MARPNKVGIPYFSLDTDFFEDTKIKMLLSKFGSDGIAVFLKILNTAYKEHGYFLPADEDNLLILSGELNIPFEKITEIIEFMCNKNLFNDIQKQTNKILTSERMQLQYIAGTERREEIHLNSSYLLVAPDKGKRKNHKAKIYVDDKCITETELMYNNNQEIDNINTQSKVKKSESESKVKEIEKESKVKVKDLATETSLETFSVPETFEKLKSEKLTFVKNLFSTYTRIRDPNEATHLKPILDLISHVPIDLSQEDIETCLKASFSKLNPDKGVKMDFLLSNIQGKLISRTEEILQNRKQIELKEARNEQKKQEIISEKENQEYILCKVREYKSFVDLHFNMFTETEKGRILRLLEGNQVMLAGLIIEPKMELMVGR